METIVAWFTLQKIASIITILAGLGVFTPKGRSLAKRVWNRTFGYHTYLLRKHIEDEDGRMEEIRAELKPNGGASLRDAIDRISCKLSVLEAMNGAAYNVHDVAIFRADTNGNVIYTNRAHQRLTGFGFAESRGEGWINYLHPSERDRIQRIWQQAVEGGREVNEDILFISPDHEPYKVRAHVFREEDSEGRIRGYLGVIHPLINEEPTFDITDSNNS